jgi:hypothetical protein
VRSARPALRPTPAPALDRSARQRPILQLHPTPTMMHTGTDPDHCPRGAGPGATERVLVPYTF